MRTAKTSRTKQPTMQNDGRRHLTILLIVVGLFLSPERGMRADPESRPERTAKT